MVDCPEAPTLASLTAALQKTFPTLGNFTITYFDADEDEIIIDQQVDLDTFLASTSKKPKIHLRVAPSEQPQPHRPPVPEDEAKDISEEEVSKLEGSVKELSEVSQEGIKEEDQP